MVKKYISLLLAAVMLTVLAAPMPSIAKQATGAGLTAPVTGTSASGAVTGSFNVLEFVRTGDATNPLGARGTLTLTMPDGRTAVTQVIMPVQLASGATGGTTGAISTQQLGTCEILELTLGPLDLNLLGLVVHLDTVHLTIDANPAGGLLGQLLCAIANLLGPGGTLGNLIQLVNLLNQLLALLSGL